MKQRPKPVAALDIETTPGKYGEKPTPICVCIKSNDLRFAVKFWGDDCILEASQFLVGQKVKGRLLAHNGGKFDFGYFVHDPGKKRVIGSRLLASSVTGWETLDTMLLMPTALKNLGHGQESKGEMRLEWHHLDATEEQREYILTYCLQDCDVLLKAYSRFCKVFTGDESKACKDTAASNAFTALKGIYKDAPATAWQTTKEYDDRIRPYYHGGIVNTFGHARDIEGVFTMVDANSMYPAAMKNYQHPVSNRVVDVVDPKLTRDGKLAKFGDRVFFVEFVGYSDILPHVKDNGGLEYGVHGTYKVTSHELQAAIRHNLVRVDKVLAVVVFQDTQNFGEFVDLYYGMRQAAKADKNPEEYVYKIVLNSAYGKFGQNPDNYKETEFRLPGDVPENDPAFTDWKRIGKTDDGFNIVWERAKIIQQTDRAFVNVGTAASITGAARACLIDAIGATLKAGGRVHYCDTDSLVFEGLPCMDLGNKLGQWKVECELDRLVIAGPKLYAFRDAETGSYKVASKGVRVSADEIIDLVSGAADIEYLPDMGSHDKHGVYRTIKRMIKRDSLKR